VPIELSATFILRAATPAPPFSDVARWRIFMWVLHQMLQVQPNSPRVINVMNFDAKNLESSHLSPNAVVTREL
jgi:hypothetical protein